MQIIGDLLRKLGHQPWFAQAIKAAAPLDKRLYRISGGRLRLAIGQPQLLLTTIGRKSGLPRTVPLLYARDGDTYVVVASNMGQAKHPAWMYNLTATPEATLNVRGREFPVRARIASDSDRERVWPKVTQVYPAYDTYVARASHRDIRVFLLDEVTAQEADEAMPSRGAADDSTDASQAPT